MAMVHDLLYKTTFIFTKNNKNMKTLKTIIQ